MLVLELQLHMVNHTIDFLPILRPSTYLLILSYLKNITHYSGHLILTTKKESPKKCEKPLLDEDIFEHHPTVIRGMMMQKLNLDFDEEVLVLGVDPGQRIGLSIFYYGCGN